VVLLYLSGGGLVVAVTMTMPMMMITSCHLSAVDCSRYKSLSIVLSGSMLAQHSVGLLALTTKTATEFK
jgi:hypothetical protein